MIKRVFHYECFDATVSFAQSIGWIDWFDDDAEEYTPEIADALESDAIDFIQAAGFEIIRSEDHANH